MISVLNMVTAIPRYHLCSITNLRNFSTNTYPLYFRATEILLGEPLKRKKKLDPAIVRAREERRRKKLEKRIRQLEKHTNHFKPIFEIDVLPTLLKNEVHEVTSLTEEEFDSRILLEKEWCKYKREEWLKDLRVIKSIMRSQEIALEELKVVSINLYKKAIQSDDSSLPYTAEGPVRTPPIHDYDSPDGEYIETTIKYFGE